MCHNLQILSRTENIEILNEIADRHGLKIKEKSRGSGHIMWSLASQLDCLTLCNFLSDVGYNNIQSTVSHVYK